MKNKVVIITGGASGIGEATAALFAAEGARVVVSDIQEEKGKAVVERIKKNGGNAAFFKADVSVAEENEALVNFAIETYGKLDIAVNNAGIGGEANKIADMSLEGWHKVISVNLDSLFYGMKYQIPAMQKNGGGSIVNISSILGSVGFMGSAGYVAAKHAALGITKTAALEYSSENIRVNAVGPAFIDTPLLDQLDDDLKQQLVAMHPIGRFGKGKEVAELILWLGSDKASFATGAYYPIDGGYLAR
ncbi:NAD(P)-dependent dehydrogenase, short-chain alcohol dehydrogenase family [Salinimicrobium catena]|uniref:NAD(P)-dependent dehydrogenase, short-chain alcohol dehydrogenase family n=1 Tax=Salinimicrobium catena TaxID=390640 RepID=A0A1H5NYJ0_9FLAO|nr:glucose 1-dehydrogenase [Salinimicrobium catena]SDL59180.1 NAD(P)-dependent dehydrogenase, short-chain alcohol dehydrogenase family [Salinimicrobium catena]SEF05867.1 NAD(P)-dependent dehydrogenase, short-chain alcohol dehydrogenase family [Salinimicrobium catena]